jgi:hypothetical protein
MRSQLHVSPRTIRVGTVAALSAVALAVPAAAHAAAVVTDRTCYTEGDVYTVAGGGFTPGTTVSISGDGISGSAPVLANGAFIFQGSAPEQFSTEAGDKKIPITVIDSAGVATAGIVRVARIGVSQNPSSGNPRKKVRWRFSGFDVGKVIYSHVRRGGKTYRHRFGKAKGPCGTLKAKARLLPIPKSKVRSGTYKVQIDTSKAYHKHQRPRLTYGFQVFTTFG